jgi:hypothetical protein
VQFASDVGNEIDEYCTEYSADMQSDQRDQREWEENGDVFSISSFLSCCCIGKVGYSPWNQLHHNISTLINGVYPAIYGVCFVKSTSTSTSTYNLPTYYYIYNSCALATLLVILPYQWSNGLYEELLLVRELEALWLPAHPFLVAAERPDSLATVRYLYGVQLLSLVGTSSDM